MKPQLQKVHLFKEEMKFFLQNWKPTNENENQWWKANIEESQLNAYPNNKKLTQDQLGLQEDSEKLDLIIVNPRTGELEPVGSGSARLARKYFEDNENMRWPPYCDIVRMGLFFYWGYYRIVNMVLKVHWEKYLKSKAWGIMKYNHCEGLSDLLKNSTKAIESMY